MRVLVPVPVLSDLQERLAARLPHVELLSYTEDSGDVSGAQEAEAVFRWIAGKQYEGLVLNGPQVRWLHTASAGVDHVLTPALKARGNFTLTDSGPAFGICIGEFVLAWMLAVAHRLPALIDSQRAKRWQGVTQEELYGQTVGIIGLGPIGRGISERCRALGMHTIGLRRSPVAESAVDETLTGPEGLHRLLEQSDWVVIAAASTPETRALLGADELARMKSNARIVNIARGALIEETALIEALRTGKIAGACLDVFTHEPLPQDSPLWEMPNVYVTPHNSPGWTEGLKRRQLELFVANLERFARNERLEGIVDFERGY